jgi:mannose-6-phosphate isomerase
LGRGKEPQLKKPGKLVTLATALIFVLEPLSYYQSYGLTSGNMRAGSDLAAPSMFDDILNSERKDMEAIRLAAAANLELLREKTGAVHDGPLASAEGVFQPADMQFFFRESSELEDGCIGLMCRIKEEGQLTPRTYYVILPPSGDPEDRPPVDVLTQTEYSQYRERLRMDGRRISGREGDERTMGEQIFESRNDVRKKADPVEKAVSAFRKDPSPIVMECGVMDYAWGDPEYLPELLGEENPGAKPYAELWIGAHPKAPAVTRINGQNIELNELISRAPVTMLGTAVSREFGKKLPYLFKVLTASTALSIQSHPSKEQARKGWAREGGRGPNYRDDNHKPEIICAITDFWALNGFRDVQEILDDLVRLDIPGLEKEVRGFRDEVERASGEKIEMKKALKDLYSGIMRRVAAFRKAQTEEDAEAQEKTGNEISRIVSSVINTARKRLAETLSMPAESDIISFVKAAEERGRVMDLKRDLWALRLGSQYPDDMGVLSVYLLNLVKLAPGEAMYLPAGELHAYLGKLDPDARDEGAGIELMANSDNVLRGGLTPKHVDVPELIRTLTFNHGAPDILEPEGTVYGTDAEEFELSVLSLGEEETFTAHGVHSADSLVVLEGRVRITGESGGGVVAERGDTVMVPADAGAYEIRAVAGNARLYKAGVPGKEPGVMAVEGSIDAAAARVKEAVAGKTLREALREYVGVYNRMIEAYGSAGNEAGSGTLEGPVSFTARLMEDVITNTDEAEAARQIQLVAGQAVTIMSWIDRKVPGARGLRLTADDDDMLLSGKGKSFIDRNTIPSGTGHTEKENEPGMFWRGMECTDKLGKGLAACLEKEEGLTEDINGALVMYLMDHGFAAVPEGIRHLTGAEGGIVSTLHETAFLADNLVGSSQTTSTGPGHFQGRKLDIKHVVSGRGIQFNVRYGGDGKIEEILAQVVETGDACLALPGHVDYMVNLGGLRFNDMAVTLPVDRIRALFPALAGEDISRPVKPDNAPYLGIRESGLTGVLRHMKDEEAPRVVWVAPLDVFSGKSLLETYMSLSGSGDVDSLVACVSEAFGKAERTDVHSRLPVMSASRFGVSARDERDTAAAALTAVCGILKTAGRARRAGLALPTHPDTRYTLIVPAAFYANGKLDEHRARYGDRFDLCAVSTGPGENGDRFIEKVLAGAAGVEKRTAALVPGELDRKQLEKLTRAGIRFIRVDADALLEARVDEGTLRERFQRDTYAVMLLARKIDGKTADDSAVYRLFDLYIRSHFELEDVGVHDYIKAVVNGDIRMLLKGLFSIRPAKAFRVPDYHTVSAVMMSA